MVLIIKPSDLDKYIRWRWKFYCDRFTLGPTDIYYGGIL